jgi:hypothetical protein
MHAPAGGENSKLQCVEILCVGVRGYHTRPAHPMCPGRSKNSITAPLLEAHSTRPTTTSPTLSAEGPLFEGYSRVRQVVQLMAGCQ